MREVKKVFKVDPNMRADMIEVCMCVCGMTACCPSCTPALTVATCLLSPGFQVSRLSRRVKLAEDRSAHLATLLEEGINERLEAAQAAIEKNQEEAVKEFAMQADNAKAQAMDSMRSMQGMLTTRVSVRWWHCGCTSLPWLLGLWCSLHLLNTGYARRTREQVQGHGPKPGKTSG